MATVLVVDDSALDRKLAGNLLENEARLAVLYAADGRQALSTIQRQPPDLVLTDLLMPEMDGLQLVEEIRSKHPAVPVILMTAHGSEELAVEALQKGAASYVPKKRLVQDLSATVKDVLALARADRRQQQLLECMTKQETGFLLGSSPTLIPPLVAHLQDNMALMKLCDETGLIRVGIALSEALDNALYHGILEISSELRETDYERYRELVMERCKQVPYCDRRIHVEAKLSRSEALFMVRDEGPGFDPSALPDPTDPANLEKLSGRGVLLIRTFMDEVSYNDVGNEVSMIKRREIAGLNGGMQHADRPGR